MLLTSCFPFSGRSLNCGSCWQRGCGFLSGWESVRDSDCCSATAGRSCGPSEQIAIGGWIAQSVGQQIAVVIVRATKSEKPNATETIVMETLASLWQAAPHLASPLGWTPLSCQKELPIHCLGSEQLSEPPWPSLQLAEQLVKQEAGSLED